MPARAAELRPREFRVSQPLEHSVAAVRITLIATAAVFLSSCQPRNAGFSGFPPAEVSVVAVVPRDVPETFEFPGEVAPYRRIEVRSRVEGVIEQRPFTEGAIVKPGDLLYRLDKVKYEAALRSARARLENSKQSLDRVVPLLAQQVVAQQDVDNARAEHDAAQAAYDQAKKDLDDTDVRARIEGRVGRTLLEVGARVTGPSDLLTTIDRLDSVYVIFEPSSQQLLQWREKPAWRSLIEPRSRL
ncbi:MAG: efflux RND transporter periplasmic adaptor subunit, partial [Candidatus Eisenbacteria bacterium]